MSITIKQLGALSKKFDFDIDEARRFLGHTEPKKRGRPVKKTNDSEEEAGLLAFMNEVCSGGTCKKSASSKSKTKKPESKSPTGKRTTGYQLYMKSQGVPIVVAAKQWKALSDSTRKSWNSKAEKM